MCFLEWSIMCWFLYLHKEVDIFNIIPNKHLSGGIIPVSLDEKQREIRIFIMYCDFLYTEASL